MAKVIPRRVTKQLGDRITELRGDMTQEQLAERSGLSHRQLQRIEVGQVNIRVVMLARVAAGLGVPAHELLMPPTKKIVRRRGRPRRAES